MTKYRLMFLLSKRENLGDLYKFDTTEIDDKIVYREFETLEEADSYVETLLNQQGYSKEDIIVVREKEFDIGVKIKDDEGIGDGTGEGGTGTNDYNDLINKPKINNIELSGNKTLLDLSIQSTSDNTLTTTDKTIVGAINEINALTNGISETLDEINGEVI